MTNNLIVNNLFLETTGQTLALFSRNTVIYLIISFSAVMFAYILMNSFWSWFQKDKYQGVRFTTKNIAYITMLSSVSVVATIVISVIIPLPVLPAFRIAIEGLMIKITGYLFGPVIGIICAGITDMLVMLFVPSYIHPLYIFCVVLTGFLAGVAGVLKLKLKDYWWIILLLIHLFLLFFAGGGAYLAWSGSVGTYVINGFSFSKYIAVAIIAGGGLITLLAIYGTLFVYWKKNEMQKIKEILPIILLAVVSEYVVAVLLVSYADMVMVSSETVSDYSVVAVVRIITAPFQIIINSVIIYTTWRIVSPLIKIDNANYY